jgi:hypothetical protein
MQAPDHAACAATQAIARGAANDAAIAAKERPVSIVWKCLTLALVLIAAGCAAPGAAQAQWHYGRVDVEIFDRSEGRVLPTYYYNGRRYVVGKPGNEYAIRVRNTMDRRALAVMSVDGINIITGDTAGTAQSGYVFAPGESADIAGWRKDMSRTAAFYFTTLPDSYAARTGRPDNVGVIGIAVFRERSPVRLTGSGALRKDSAADSRERAEANAASPASPSSAPAAPESQALDAARAQASGAAEAKSLLGTGHGRNESSYTQYTAFQRESETPMETISIYYDSYQNLLAMGVPVGPQPMARVRPEPFPMHFVPDPR